MAPESPVELPIDEEVLPVVNTTYGAVVRGEDVTAPEVIFGTSEIEF